MEEKTLNDQQIRMLDWLKKYYGEKIALLFVQLLK